MQKFHEINYFKFSINSLIDEMVLFTMFIIHFAFDQITVWNKHKIFREINSLVVSLATFMNFLSKSAEKKRENHFHAIFFVKSICCVCKSGQFCYAFVISTNEMNFLLLRYSVVKWFLEYTLPFFISSSNLLPTLKFSPVYFICTFLCL